MLDNNAKEFIEECEKELTSIFSKIDDECNYNSYKVLKAFKDNNVDTSCFISSTGYGFDDIGRSVIDNVYKDIFETEDALVRCQLVSGSNALNIALQSVLRPNDIMLSITGLPYDTLHRIIGIKDNPSSLKSFGVKYEQIDLINDDFDYDKIEKAIKSKKIKLIEIQRSKGYSVRKSLTVDKVNKVYDFIKSIDNDIIILIDNCYCEFVGKDTLKGDLIVGSLIKNLGGGITPTGGYIVGRKDLVELSSERLTLPGEGKDIGPTLGMNKEILMGLFFAPQAVKGALKTSILTSYVMEKLGYDVEPKYSDTRADIVENIIFNDRDKLIKYCQIVQASSPIDSNFTPVPCAIGGYDDEIIMAAGCFIQGSTIEFSCDGPLRPPYIAYQQGSLTYEYGRLAVMNIYSYFKNM